MKTTSLQSLMSILTPPSNVQGVTAYLAVAVRAVGGRADADLARTMGVSPASVANWKRRGTVPADSQQWFRGTLIEKIATYTRELRPVDVVAREAVVHLLVATNGNPLGVREHVVAVTANALPGLFVAAQFIYEAALTHGEDAERLTGTRVAELLGAGMLFFRHGDQFRQYIEVPQ